MRINPAIQIAFALVCLVCAESNRLAIARTTGFDVAKADANLPLVVRLTGSDGTGRNAVSRSAARFALAVGVAGREVELLSAAVGTRGVRSDRCSGHSGADTTALLPVAQPTVSQENGSQLSGDS